MSSSQQPLDTNNSGQHVPKKDRAVSQQVAEDVSNSVLCTSTLQILSNGRVGIKHLKLRAEKSGQTSSEPCNNGQVLSSEAATAHGPALQDAQVLIKNSAEPLKKQQKKKVNMTLVGLHVFLCLPI
ncbi:hypothetical protein CVT25_001520 [Psilocybe cyanescens]|uniref:Uncharacterized protein n=1 Tax=Psilocybe cyanescens TaxID=93625 RepID=A0A409X5F6_PSICY|nr:hypothetical protein CVT25_001520 [Psilocybe cyanescens]